MKKALPFNFLYHLLTFFFLSTFLINKSNGQINLEVTEIFPGQAGTDLTADWFEIKNSGTSAWISGTDPDLYYDDESASASDADLIQGITSILPGNSVIVLVTGDPADITTFTTVWGAVIDLTGIEIGYSDGAGLGGGGDAVNIWLGDPMASMPAATGSYPTTDAFDGKSFDVDLQVFSEVGNANGAVQTIALGGAGDVPNIGSPGDQGPIAVNPNIPLITGDTANVNPLIALSAQGPTALGSDISDPTDPAAQYGIPLLFADADHAISDLTILVNSDNENVVPLSNLVITGSGDSRLLKITPTEIGFTTITVSAEDPDNNIGTYVINYAASNATLNPSSSRFHYGASDGSTAIDLDADYMLIADDEDQTIRLFNRSLSGNPIYSKNFNNDLNSTTEVDHESSFIKDNTIYWMGSNTNTERSVIFSTTLSGTGAASQLTFEGAYRDLRAEFILWDDNNLHGLGAGFYGMSNGLEIEAMSTDPNNPDGALIAFRVPQVDKDVLILPVNNFQEIVSNSASPGSATFGTPIQLDLFGHTPRSISCNDDGCLILAGPAGNAPGFKLFTWTGNPMDAPEWRSVDLNGITNMSNIEGIVNLPAGPIVGSAGDNAEIQLLLDTGTFDYYGDGREAKDLPNPEWKKCRTERVVLGAARMPPIANPGDIVINEIMQNPDAVFDSNGEWFELYNTTDEDIDLNGWKIKDNDVDSFIVATSMPLIIQANGFLVMGIDSNSTTNGGLNVDYRYPDGSFFLSNNADEIVLIAPDSIEIDRVEYDGGTTFPDPAGTSMSLQSELLDNNSGANWCEAMTAYGDGDFGTPGMANDCPPPAVADLRITEIWSGQDGTDLTADWFEITNFGQLAWVSGMSPDLYYDDESQEPADADLINGITDIQPGESVIVVIDPQTAVDVFFNVWSPDYDLTDVEIGWTEGAGLGAGGDGVTLFIGSPSVGSIADFATYPAAPSGVSYDIILGDFSQQGAGMVQLGTNIAVATTATAGSSGMEPAIGSPGNKGPVNVLTATLKITEIFPGQSGDDLTADWFEIKNTGTSPWISGTDPDLFYDDESASAADADIIQGLTDIGPDETVIVLVTDNVNDITTFRNIWEPVIDLSNIEIGYTDGAGLGGGGDQVTLWIGDPMSTMPADTASYPATDLFDGQSYDVELQAFSVVGNANGAVQTLAFGGDLMDVPNIGSPGDGLAIPAENGLTITEIFPGQAGEDLTVDWFEIKNTGTTAWVSGTDPDLYYDDESASAADADLIQGITDIQPDETVLVLLTNDGSDITAFRDVWEPVIDLTGIEIGFVDGAGLGGGGDRVTLWLGDPSAFIPIDTASYPETDLFDGQSYDVELQAFSVVGNANGAVQTLALGGDGMNVPNIGSPGNQITMVNTEELITANSVKVFPNPSSGFITIESLDGYQLESVSIMDMNGRHLLFNTVEGADQIQLDLSQLASAMYLLQIQNERGVVVKRFVKE